MLYEFINKEIKYKSAVEKLLITHKHYPAYKDLEPTKIYDFNITTEINNTINNIIIGLRHYTETKKEELSEKKKQSKMGINIDSMIHEQQYTIIILEERIHMFENYLTTFGNHHSKYFSRLTIKVKIMLGVVNEDFHLKNSKSLQLKKGDNKTASQSLLHISPIQNYETSDSETSSTGSGSGSNRPSIPTPSASMNDEEENNVRFLVGDMNESKDIDIQRELNIILQNIPQNEESERSSSRRQTIKRNNNTIMDI
jgi:hypothetical protein